MENYLNCHAAKNGVTVAYRNQLFTRGSNCKVLTCKSLVHVLDSWLLLKRLYYGNTGNKN